MIFLKGVGLDRRGAGKLITCIQELAGQLDDVPVLSEFTQREGRYRARRQQTSDRVEKLIFAIFRSFARQNSGFRFGQSRPISQCCRSGDLMV